MGHLGEQGTHAGAVDREAHGMMSVCSEEKVQEGKANEEGCYFRKAVGR